MDLSRILNGGRAGDIANYNHPVQHNDAKKVDSVSLGPMRGNKPIYALHNEGTSALVNFSQRAYPEAEALCHLVASRMGNTFPHGFNRVNFSFHEVTQSDDSKGFTDSANDYVNASIGLPEMAPSDFRNDFELQGRIALTAFHELFLHGLPDLHAASIGADKTSEESDHHVMVSPPDETNPYHRAIKIILPHIPAHLKTAFLHAYLKDLENARDMEEHPEDPQAVDVWCEKLQPYVDTPDAAFWR